MLMNMRLLRAATCMMVCADAELISPSSSWAPSRSSMRCAFTGPVLDALCAASDIDLAAVVLRDDRVLVIKRHRDGQDYAVLPLAEIGPILYGLVVPPAGDRVES